MFHPYTQASGGSNRSFQGTGLGLFICVSLCIQLNGFISCASTPDKGSVFFLGIPVDVVKESDDTVKAPTEDLGFRSDTIVLKGPVLIVDDNSVNVKFLKRQVERLLKLHKIPSEVVTATWTFIRRSVLGFVLSTTICLGEMAWTLVPGAFEITSTRMEWMHRILYATRQMAQIEPRS
jgi:hypothetical protein